MYDSFRYNVSKTYLVWVDWLMTQFYLKTNAKHGRRFFSCPFFDRLLRSCWLKKKQSSANDRLLKPEKILTKKFPITLQSSIVGQFYMLAKSPLESVIRKTRESFKQQDKELPPKREFI